KNLCRSRQPNRFVEKVFWWKILVISHDVLAPSPTALGKTLPSEKKAGRRQVCFFLLASKRKKREARQKVLTAVSSLVAIILCLIFPPTKAGYARHNNPLLVSLQVGDAVT